MDTFKEIIQQNRTICNNCFRRTHRVWEKNYVPQNDGYPKPVRDSLEDILQPYREALKISTQEIEKQGTGTKGGTKKICNCGAFHNETKLRPLSKERAIELTHRLVDRLDEEDVEFDEDELYSYIRDKKSNPDEQFKDDSLFAEAVQYTTQ